MCKFIQEKGYLEDERLTLYYPQKLDKDEVYNILLIRSDTNQYERVSAMLNLAAEMTVAIDINRSDYDSNTNKDGLDLKIVEMLRTLSRFIGYLSGCSSWRDKKLHDFDKEELYKRLEQLEYYFKN